MRVGVELMMTNISAAKSSLRPSKITHGTEILRASSGWVSHEKAQRGQAMLAVNDEKFFLRLAQLSDARTVGPGIEVEFLRREQEDGAGDGRLG